MSYDEFELIKQYFSRLTNNFHSNVEEGIGDDCALINIPDKHTLAVSIDTLVSNIHFLPNIEPKDLGYKALAVNLSDLAAVGADPTWLMLALTLPRINKNWLSEFSNSLFEQLDYYKIQLIGGDITKGPLSLTLTIHGLLPIGSALKRSGAKIDDWIFVTGTLGDSAAGLSLLLKNHNLPNSIITNTLIKRHLRPTPRITEGQILRNLATAAIDISDGLISDLSKILNASHVGAQLNLDLLPFSPILFNNFSYNQILTWALSGGEDYELCFTVSENNIKKLDIVCDYFEVPYTCIGKIVPKIEGLILLKNKKPVDFNYQGFNHFDVE